MATIQQSYGTTNQTITCTINSLADGSARESTAVDNRTNKFQDVLVQLIVITAAGTIASEKCVKVYAYGTVDDGTSYSDTCTGTDAAHTLVVPPNAVLIAVINTPTAATSYESHPTSIAAAFNGVVPAFWGIIVENKTGLAMGSTGNSAKYQGIKTETV